MRCLFLYNPNSGKGKIRKKLPLIERTLKTRYDEVMLYATKSAEDLKSKVAESAEEFDAIIVAGGDGTFHLVIDAIGEREVKLGFLPAGTANDVARSLGIPTNTKKALQVILNGRYGKVDCMRINEKDHAMYIAAAGVFTQATYSTPQAEKRRLGWFAYGFEGLKERTKFNSFPIEITCGERHEKVNAVLILAMNGRSVAGFLVNKRASMQDGKIEVVVLRDREKLGAWGRLRAFLLTVRLFLFGCRRDSKHFLRFEGDSVSVKAGEDVVWDLDGEKGDSGNVSIRVLQKHVTMFVPKNKKI